MYLNCFLPSVVTDLNALPIDVRNLDSLLAFKHYINRDRPNPNMLNSFGERRIHARLRTKCSSLHQHLYSPLCDCGKIEPNQHYFFDCRYYREFRNILFQSVSEISTVSLQTLLFGDETLSLADNEKYSQQFTHILLTLIVLEVESSFESLFLFLKSTCNVAPISSLFVYQNINNIRYDISSLSLSLSLSHPHTHTRPTQTPIHKPYFVAIYYIVKHLTLM